MGRLRRYLNVISECFYRFADYRAAVSQTFQSKGRRKTMPFIAVLLLIFSLTLGAAPALADLWVLGPSADTAALASSPDYATEVLNNPWDFNDSSDLANYIYDSDNGGTAWVADGLLHIKNGGFAHLLSPAICDTNLVGKTGARFPIDTTRYRYLTVRLYTDKASNLRVVVNTSCNYFPTFWETVPITTSAGWGTYVIDMQTVGHIDNNGQAWGSQPVTGLRLDPGVEGVETDIDWVRLAAEPVDGYTLSYSYRDMGRPFVLFLDGDQNPGNGFERLLSEPSVQKSAVTITDRGLYPGSSYYVVGAESADFASLFLNPWDMASVDDLSVAAAMTLSFDSGWLHGITNATGGPYFFLNQHGHNLDAQIFHYLTLDFSTSYWGDVLVYFWGPEGQFKGATAIPSVGANKRQEETIDLANVPGWSGQIAGLQLAFGNNATFDIYSVGLRSDGPGGPDPVESFVSSPAPLHINSPPLLRLLQPDDKGGEDFASTVLANPWNMEDTGDVYMAFNSQNTRILPNNFVVGLQGDFYGAASINGNGDPHQVSLYNLTDPSHMLDAARYHNLSWRMLVDRNQDVVTGSVSRVVWSVNGDADGKYYNSEDIVVLNGWNEYTLDLRAALLEKQQHPAGSYPVPPWRGLVNYFRVDSHEFSVETPFYFDYIRVTADDEANSRFALAVEAGDSDSPAKNVTVSFFMNSQHSTSGGTAIGSLSLDQGRVLLWGTSAVPDGSYWIYAVISDGLNSNTRLSGGPVTISHSRPQNAAAPVLSVDTPGEGATLYNTFIATGFALDDIQLAAVNVLVDGVFVQSFLPDRFNAQAQAAYGTWAESGNSGFRTLIDLSSIQPGPHTLQFTAYDTAGNKIESPLRHIIHAFGPDPAPPPEPTPTNADPITVSPDGHPPVQKLTLKLKAALALRKRSASFQINGGSGCAVVNLIAAETKKALDSAPQILTNVTGTDSLKWSAQKLKGVKLQKGQKAVKVYVAAGCDGRRASAIRTLSPSRIGGSKAKNLMAWLNSLKKKLK
jgi:hypothetical protein